MLDSMHLEMAQFQGVPWSMSMSPVKSGAFRLFHIFEGISSFGGVLGF